MCRVGIIFFLLGLHAFAQTFVQSATCSGTNPSITCTFTNPIGAGHTIIVQEGASPFSTTTTITDTLGNTYTPIYAQSTPVNGRMGTWAVFNTLGGADTVTMNEDGFNVLGIIAEYTSTSVVDNAATGSANGTSAVASPTFVHAGDLVVGSAFIAAASTTWSLSTMGWTSRATVSVAAFITMTLWDQVLGSSGSFATTFSSTSSGPMSVGIAGLNKPTSTGQTFIF